MQLIAYQSSYEALPLIAAIATQNQDHPLNWSGNQLFYPQIKP